ncbi:MAG TPA: DNA mismatch repair protein MutL, partial [Bacteroidetes bacterium]|nr:DNA mismatch repair protein MutL [Bacteroidota bacterium]
MAKIKLLPREVYSKIAAGEVIDGPYSVVRELIDNSEDAEAGQIKVYTKNGGKELIVVQDDGTGMSWEDAELALKRHATSKISEAQDLEHIRTMGFRGEALSSISSVSDFELITKDRESDSGVKLNCEYGRFIKIEPVPFSAGTKISVRNLFENLPARKRFMKSNRSESSRVKDVVIKKALCFNGIAFRYESEDSLVITLPKGQSKIERIKNLFGEEIEPIVTYRYSFNGYIALLYQGYQGNLFYHAYRPSSATWSGQSYIM